MPASEVRRIIEHRRERANKPFVPLAPVVGNGKGGYISTSDEFYYDEH